MTSPNPDALLPLFSAPLAAFHIPDVATLNATLTADTRALRATSLDQNRSNQNGGHSDDNFFHHQEPGCRRLQQHILDSMRQVTVEIASDFNFAAQDVQMESWVNLNGRGGFNAPHDHPAWARHASTFSILVTSLGLSQRRRC